MYPHQAEYPPFSFVITPATQSLSSHSEDLPAPPQPFVADQRRYSYPIERPNVSPSVMQPSFEPGFSHSHTSTYPFDPRPDHPMHRFQPIPPSSFRGPGVSQAHMFEPRMMDPCAQNPHPPWQFDHPQYPYSSLRHQSVPSFPTQSFQSYRQPSTYHHQFLYPSNFESYPSASFSSSPLGPRKAPSGYFGAPPQAQDQPHPPAQIFTGYHPQTTPAAASTSRVGLENETGYPVQGPSVHPGGGHLNIPSVTGNYSSPQQNSHSSRRSSVTWHDLETKFQQGKLENDTSHFLNNWTIRRSFTPSVHPDPQSTPATPLEPTWKEDHPDLEPVTETVTNHDRDGGAGEVGDRDNSGSSSWSDGGDLNGSDDTRNLPNRDEGFRRDHGGRRVSSSDSAGGDRETAARKNGKESLGLHLQSTAIEPLSDDYRNLNPFKRIRLMAYVDKESRVETKPRMIRRRDEHGGEFRKPDSQGKGKGRVWGGNSSSPRSSSASSSVRDTGVPESRNARSSSCPLPKTPTTNQPIAVPSGLPYDHNAVFPFFDFSKIFPTGIYRPSAIPPMDRQLIPWHFRFFKAKRDTIHANKAVQNSINWRKGKLRELPMEREIGTWAKEVATSMENENTTRRKRILQRPNPASDDESSDHVKGPAENIGADLNHEAQIPSSDSTSLNFIQADHLWLGRIDDDIGKRGVKDGMVREAVVWKPPNGWDQEYGAREGQINWTDGDVLGRHADVLGRHWGMAPSTNSDDEFRPSEGVRVENPPWRIREKREWTRRGRGGCGGCLQNQVFSSLGEAKRAVEEHRKQHIACLDAEPQPGVEEGEEEEYIYASQDLEEMDPSDALSNPGSPYKRRRPKQRESASEVQASSSRKRPRHTDHSGSSSTDVEDPSYENNAGNVEKGKGIVLEQGDNDQQYQAVRTGGIEGQDSVNDENSVPKAKRKLLAGRHLFEINKYLRDHQGPKPRASPNRYPPHWPEGYLEFNENLQIDKNNLRHYSKSRAEKWVEDQMDGVPSESFPIRPIGKTPGSPSAPILSGNLRPLPPAPRLSESTGRSRAPSAPAEFEVTKVGSKRKESEVASTASKNPATSRSKKRAKYYHRDTVLQAWANVPSEFDTVGSTEDGASLFPLSSFKVSKKQSRRRSTVASTSKVQLEDVPENVKLRFKIPTRYIKPENLKSKWEADITRQVDEGQAEYPWGQLQEKLAAIGLPLLTQANHTSVFSGNEEPNNTGVIQCTFRSSFPEGAQPNIIIEAFQKSSSDSSEDRKPATFYFPAHTLILATQLNLFQGLQKGLPSAMSLEELQAALLTTSGHDTQTQLEYLPIVRLELSSLKTFPILYAWIYTRSPQHLSSVFLPSSPLPAQFIDPSTNTWMPRHSISESVELLLPYSSQTDTLIHLALLAEFWDMAVWFEAKDETLWETCNLCWEILIGVLRRHKESEARKGDDIPPEEGEVNQQRVENPREEGVGGTYENPGVARDREEEDENKAQRWDAKTDQEKGGSKNVDHALQPGRDDDNLQDRKDDSSPRWLRRSKRNLKPSSSGLSDHTQLIGIPRNRRGKRGGGSQGATEASRGSHAHREVKRATMGYSGTGKKRGKGNPR